MPIRIGDFLYIPKKGNRDGHRNASILVRKIGDDIYPKDISAIRSELTVRFPRSDYELMIPESILSAGVTSITVLIRYTRQARPSWAHNEGKFIPVVLSKITEHLNSPPSANA